MKRNWYAVYTKVSQERRVAALLSKKKIENFIPLNRTVLSQGVKSKIESEPLFSSFVFVYITAAEMDIIKGFNYITNFVYWLGEPAIIKDAEIENLKHFTNEYTSIKLEKINVSTNGTVRIINSAKSQTSDFKTIQNSIVKLVLPSLGYNLVSEMINEKAEEMSYNLNSNLVSQAK